MGEELGRRDSYRGAVKDTKKMAEADAAADSSKGGKKAAGKEKMEDLKKELTLDDHIITWEEFHVRHEGSNRVSGLTESKAAEIHPLFHSLHCRKGHLRGRTSQR